MPPTGQPRGRAAARHRPRRPAPAPRHQPHHHRPTRRAHRRTGARGRPGRRRRGPAAHGENATGRSPWAESFRHLRTNLRFARIGERPGAVVVTSPLPGEGKTATATALALSLAASGTST
ncbi:hypothetical protein ACFQVA_37285 [Actinomadura keratinilytica]